MTYDERDFVWGKIKQLTPERRRTAFFYFAQYVYIQAMEQGRLSEIEGVDQIEFYLHHPGYCHDLNIHIFGNSRMKDLDTQDLLWTLVNCIQEAYGFPSTFTLQELDHSIRILCGQYEAVQMIILSLMGVESC